MLTINSLPYIDGTPDSDQERIEWVKNGEKTLGSSTRYGSDGVLNRVGNQLNSNIQFLYNTTQSIASILNQNSNDINIIKTSLNLSSNTNLINDVQNTKIQISNLTEENTSLKSDVSDLTISNKSLLSSVGTKDLTDTSTRSVFQDLLWIKTELGNYASQDFNGQPVNDLSPSGLKGRYTSISTAVAAHDKSIADLTKNFKDSNVANMNVKIQAISDKLTLNDTNINSIQNNISQTATAINDLQLAIDFTNNKSISTRVTTAESKLATIDNDLNSTIGIKATMNSINNLLSSRGGISDQVSTANTNINSISAIIGNTTSDGLRGQVSWIISKAGIVQDGSVPPENSIAGNLRSLESMHSSLSISFQDLQTQVGTSTSGIQGDIINLKSGNYGYGIDLRLIGAVGDGKSDNDEAILKKALASGFTVFNGGKYKITDINIVYQLKSTSGTASVVHYGNVYPFGDIQDQFITLKVPGDFYNIQHAMEWLSNKRILGNSGVDIVVADGTYTQTWTNNLNHIDGAKISIRGNESDRSKVIINLDNSDNRDCFAVSNGHTIGWLNGFTIVGTTGWKEKGSWNDQSFGAGIRAFNGGVINCGTAIHVDKMYYGLRAMHSATISAIGSSSPNIKGGGVLVTNAGDVGIHAHTATIYCNCAEVSDSSDNAHGLGFGFCAEAGGYIVCEYALAKNNTKAGFYALSNGTMWAHGVASSGNMHGVLSWGGTVECNSLGSWITELNDNTESGITSTFRGFVGANAATVARNKNGIVSTEGSTLDATAVVSSSNTGHGVLSIDNGYITGYKIQSLNNKLDGFHCENQSRMKAIDATASGNTGAGYYATKYSTIISSGMGGDKNGSFCSPLQSSVAESGGNTQSYINDQ